VEPDDDDIRAAIGYQLRTGIVADAEGGQGTAADALGEAVALAERQLLRWPFLEAPGALRLLQRNPRQRSQFLDDAMMHAAQDLDRSALQSQLLEPLSERELTVLEYLPGRLKNQEIAGELYVSVNTLKSHLRNIYRKLDVADRDEAVAKATEIGLL
jgi:LuxR family maltose regulon positive regulatory protein